MNMSTDTTMSNTQEAEDTCPCVVCQRQCDTGIKCNDCHMWVHYWCTGLPTYNLITLTRSSRRYSCQPCTKQNHANFEDLWEEIEKCKLDESRPSDSPLQEVNVENNNTSSARQTQEAFSLGSSPEDMEINLSLDTPITQGPPTQRDDSEQQSTSLSIITPNTTQKTTNQEGGDGAPTTMSNQTSNKSGNSHKTRICRYHRRGNCRHGLTGKNCPFKHPKLCQKYIKHGPNRDHDCKQGKECTFLHPTLCRNSLNKGMCFYQKCKFIHPEGTVRHRENKTTMKSSNQREDNDADRINRNPTTQTPHTNQTNEETTNTANLSALFLEFMGEIKSTLANVTRVMEVQNHSVLSIMAGNQKLMQPQTGAPLQQAHPWIPPQAPITTHYLPQTSNTGFQ